MKWHWGAAVLVSSMVYGLSVTSCLGLTRCDGGIDVTSGMTLGDDYVTGSLTNPCFTVKSGSTLDLHNHTISCDNYAYGCLIAVRIEDDPSASVVKNGTISGLFQVGVQVSAGADQTGQVTIQANRFDGVQTAITGGKQIKQNVITGCVNGIQWMPNNVQGGSYQYVQDNYIDCGGSSSIGIWVWSSYTRTSGNPNVQTNFVRAGMADIYAPSSSQNPGKSNITKNIVVTPANPDTSFAPIKAFGQSTTVATDNVCDADGAGINSACSIPEPPFTMP